MPHDVRDQIVDFVRRWSEASEIGAGRFIGWLGVTASKFYSWRERYGRANEHNGWVPRDFWLEDWEKQAIIGFHFTCLSTAKGGKIRSIMPQVSHADHSEHSMQIVVTERGVADLGGRTPSERAQLIINNCAHPEYREELNRYLHLFQGGHNLSTMAAAHPFHIQLLKTGDMRKVDWKKFLA